MNKLCFLSIITRTCSREKFLTENIQSVKHQSCQSIEQVFVVDRQKKGVHFANRALAENKHRMQGLYSFILDDDTWLINSNFVQELKSFVKQNDCPSIVMFKSKRPKGPPSNETVFPTSAVWKSKQPKHGTTNCLCYLIRTPLWKKYIHHFGVFAGGDWSFLNSLLKDGHKLTWLDTFSGEARQLGRGKLFEKTTKGWFERVARKEGIVDIDGKGDFRLQLWKK